MSTKPLSTLVRHKLILINNYYKDSDLFCVIFFKCIIQYYDHCIIKNVYKDPAVLSIWL